MQKWKLLDTLVTKPRISKVFEYISITTSNYIITGPFQRANQAGIFNINEEGQEDTPPDSRVDNSPSLPRFRQFTPPFHNITHVLENDGGVTHSGLTKPQRQDLENLEGFCQSIPFMQKFLGYP